MAEAKETSQYLNHLLFCIFEVKEAVEVIDAVEVIMADRTNEATEVFRFT